MFIREKRELLEGFRFKWWYFFQFWLNDISTFKRTQISSNFKSRSKVVIDKNFKRAYFFTKMQIN